MDAPLECIDGPRDCAGDVEWRYPGEGEKHWPRCVKHGERRVELAELARERYPVLAPAGFDPSYAGERWDED